MAPRKLNNRKPSKTGVIFPVGRIHRKLKARSDVKRVSKSAAIYLAATFDYLIAELIDVAAYATSCNQKKRITPRFIMAAVHNDDELCQLFRKVTIAEAGVMPRREI